MSFKFSIELNKIESLSKGSKVNRFLYRPFSYAFALFFKKIYYPFFKKEYITETLLFTNNTIRVALPAATDLYILGGKSHISEINLARFLLQNLKENSVFWDIGSHYGYFSFVANSVIRESGKIIAIEAAKDTFEILKYNCKNIKEIQVYNYAISDSDQDLYFYEFPNKFSEYNSLDIEQYKEMKWFSKVDYNKSLIEGISLNTLYGKTGEFPDIIKIDVEGGEANAIKGGLHLWGSNNKAPIIVMEYLSAARGNDAHKIAKSVLQEYGYESFTINSLGNTEMCSNIENHLLEKGLESDNIVFIKK